MANYYATTVSRGGKLKKDFDIKKLEEIMSKYFFGDGEGDLCVAVRDSVLEVWGESLTYAYHKEDEDRDEEVFHEFLEEICPFLAEPLIVSEVGNEKCRYVEAYAYIAFPSGKVVSVSLNGTVDELLSTSGVSEISVSKNNNDK